MKIIEIGCGLKIIGMTILFREQVDVIFTQYCSKMRVQKQLKSMGCVTSNPTKPPNDPSRIDFLRNTNVSFPSQINPNGQYSNINGQGKGNANDAQGDGDGDDPIAMDEDFDKSHIATSKIYRRSSVVSKKDPKQKVEEDESQEYEGTSRPKSNQICLGLPSPSTEMSEIMEGVIREQIGYSEIHIYTPSIAMEFTIPKSYAGPLIIPYVDYHQYNSEIWHQ